MKTNRCAIKKTNALFSCWILDCMTVHFPFVSLLRTWSIRRGRMLVYVSIALTNFIIETKCFLWNRSQISSHRAVLLWRHKGDASPAKYGNRFEVSIILGRILKRSNYHSPFEFQCDFSLTYFLSTLFLDMAVFAKEHRRIYWVGKWFLKKWNVIDKAWVHLYLFCELQCSWRLAITISAINK